MSEEETKDADMVGFKLEISNHKDKKVKIDLKRSNTWDTVFLLRKLSVISKWCSKCSDLFEKMYHDDEDFDKDEIIDKIENLIDNINRQANKMNIWFGFKEIDTSYFECLERLYNIPSMKNREVHTHLHDDMDLMDRYKELLHET